jgi:eukaryotic-like serine/threonine-protein kinase
MPIHDLNKDFLKVFNISTFFKPEKRGGQKIVHFVETDGKRYAMKLFLASGVDDRTTRELNIYEKFKDLEGIPNIFKIENYEGELVVFEEFIEGDTLLDIAHSYKNQHQKISLLIKSLCEIMKPIWDAEFIHRDIKPANIIIRNSGNPVLLDFGIARDLLDVSITATGLQPLSWQFGSPEQYAGKKSQISYRTDYFSLGAMAYFLYNQSLPFGNSKDEIDYKFNSGNEIFPIEDDCPLKAFFIESMKFSPAERPRLLEDLIKLLP